MLTLLEIIKRTADFLEARGVENARLNAEHLVGQALGAGVEKTGVTVHFVDTGLDTGPVIAQEPVPVRDGDTPASLHERIQAVEHRLLPDVVRRLASNDIPDSTRSAA